MIEEQQMMPWNKGGKQQNSVWSQSSEWVSFSGRCRTGRREEKSCQGRAVSLGVNLNENKNKFWILSLSLQLSLLSAVFPGQRLILGSSPSKPTLGALRPLDKKGPPAAAAGHCCFCCRGRLGGQWLMRPHRWRQRERERLPYWPNQAAPVRGCRSVNT